MQRDFRKHLGGKWELTAGGSALQGETALECASRELREETGIAAEEKMTVICADGRNIENTVAILKDEEFVYEFEGVWKFTNPFFREWLVRG